MVTEIITTGSSFAEQRTKIGELVRNLAISNKGTAEKHEAIHAVLSTVLAAPGLDSAAKKEMAKAVTDNYKPAKEATLHADSQTNKTTAGSAELAAAPGVNNSAAGTTATPGATTSTNGFESTTVTISNNETAGESNGKEL